MGRVLDAVVLKARDEDGVQAITENYIPVRLPEDVPSGRASILITRVLPDSTEARISY